MLLIKRGLSPVQKGLLLLGILALLMLSLFYVSTRKGRYSNPNLSQFISEWKERMLHYEEEQKELIKEDKREISEKSSVLGPFPENRTIFIVETKANLTKFRLSLLCAVVSAAEANPTWTVALISASKTAVTNSPSYLYNFHNVVVQWIDFDAFFATSPLASLWSKGIVKKSNYYLSHLSDLLRFTLVERFGGVYFDQDVISMHSVPEEPANFVIPDHFLWVAAAVFKFSKGHPFLKNVLNKMAKEYNPRVFGANGPRLTTRASFEYCSMPESGATRNVLLLKCPNDFRILPIASAYPIAGSNFMEYYSIERRDSVLELLHKNMTFAVHYFATQRVFWRRMGRITDLLIHPDQPLAELMKERCDLPYRMELTSNVGTSWMSPLV